VTLLFAARDERHNDDDALRKIIAWGFAAGPAQRRKARN
jgi:hypothetical protein